MTDQTKTEIRYVPRVRLRVRRVDEHAVAARAVQRARKLGAPTFAVNHGGSVANSYGYRAETECCVAVATPDGRCVVWVDRIPANKVSYAGACAAAPAYLAPWLRLREDDRVATSTWDLARLWVQRMIVDAINV